MAQPGKKPNRLINESSPYLLQHAYNPVNWEAFGDEAFERARAENKPVLISIGYSACHWCHVMEHESFEDAEVAAIMNREFINVKVDREERSDVDNLYMQAVQMMTGHGGWPLNCFVLPDGRPFYGGTYFPNVQWKNLLENLARLWKNESAKVERYATELTNGIIKSESLMTVEKTATNVTRDRIEETIIRWKKRLDNLEGGPDKAPKFPLPSNYVFLLRYAHLAGDAELQAHVDLTLRKIAFGGIYDQLHGGFCRYSTDAIWKVPHFEKMLYDNAQLVSLYCEAYTFSPKPLYKQVIQETMEFVKQEWYNKEGYFYSALDADSEGEEGKYYVWTREDLETLLGEDFPAFAAYYLINEKGYWENGNYILMRNENSAQVSAQLNLSLTELENKILACKKILRQEALRRIKPGLDDKTIASWNALMCKAAADAYLCLGDPAYREMANASANFLTNAMYLKGRKIFRTFKNGAARIDGFLEDYVFAASALISCYLVNRDEKYLVEAREITELALDLFDHPDTPLLYYTQKSATDLVARTTEIADNVVASSNSQMAVNLFNLGHYFGRESWIDKSRQMLDLVTDEMVSYGSAYSNWACLALNFVYPFHEIAIVGKNVDEIFSKLRQRGLTNSIFALSESSSELPLTKNRYVSDQTLIYVCKNNTCGLPVSEVDAAVAQMERD